MQSNNPKLAVVSVSLYLSFLISHHYKYPLFNPKIRPFILPP